MGHDLHGDHPDHDVSTPWLQPEKWDHADRFRQLDELLPTPGDVRTASGAPGPGYWQQQVDYTIDVTLDAERHRLIGSEQIVYRNNSPHELSYLWVQLDQNRFREDSTGRLREPAPDLTGSQSIRWLKGIRDRQSFDGGVKIKRVLGSDGSDLSHTIVDTMMRIDLEAPLASGATVEFSIDWEANIVPHTIGGRGCYEWFDEDGNAIYELARWFPRMCAYTDYAGWQNKQFLGRGEFTLEFGDYEVLITVPDTFVVAATGVLQSPETLLTPEQMRRFRAARTADRPILVITPEEALENELREATGTKTWVFKAENVRDFAWAASPKFAWDAWGVPVPDADHVTMAMSFFPEEGEPLWSRYSTQAVAQTIDTYSRLAVPYPYPVAISVNGPVGGMEYPMICFNGPRPEEDDTYTERTKYGLISVIIHEVGHNWFPMIINSDERQWTWMDEGLNTYCQFVTESEWEEDYPSRRGEPARMTRYMTDFRQVPIMTNSESILQFGNNAYGKPATAMNILRETVMGRELFDHAFRTYSQRWAFKRPEPADLFRTMEDSSGIDLDWFWRGWFYTTDHCDIAVVRLERFTPRSMNPDIDNPLRMAERDDEPLSISELENKGMERRTDRFPELLDFYNQFDELEVTASDRRSYERFIEELDEGEAELLELPWTFNVVTFENVGGLPMPIPLRITYEDSTVEDIMLPAELWSQNNPRVSKLLVTEQPIASVEVDPRRRIADADTSNNRYPQEVEDSRFRITKSTPGRNPMQRQLTEDARRESSGVAVTVARVLPGAWWMLTEERGDATPSEMSSELLAHERIADLRDPWDQPVTIELSGSASRDDDPEVTEFSRVRSIGPDGTPGTEDDLLWVIYLDGHIAEMETGKE
ncbi:MAG: aminopeptidase [Phycisphaerae bacterium]|nr:aminopeptidase [Phycisphaerae bacterium]